MIPAMKRYIPGSDMAVMTKQQVRAFDLWAMKTVGIPGMVLMENAGRSCAELVKEKLTDAAEQKVCIFCGKGNNGGDGYVAARHLKNSQIDVAVLICAEPDEIKGDARINLDIIKRMDIPNETLNIGRPDTVDKVRSFTAGAGLVVDAIFGTGLAGPLKPEYKIFIESINSLDCPVLAVDIPSGLDCDSGRPLGAAVKADWTVTFAAVKKGFTSGDAVLDYTGDIFVASIGIEPQTKNIKTL